MVLGYEMIEPHQLSLNTATIQKWDLRQAIEGCVRHGFGGISPWRDKLDEMGAKQAARLIRESGLAVSGLCRGGWYCGEAQLSQKILDDNKKAVDDAATLGAACLVMVVGGLIAGNRDIRAARARVEEGLARTLEYARLVGVKLAIEPLHPIYAADRACINSLRHALDICDRLGEGIGVAVDVYHVWWDEEIETQIERAGAARLMAFHMCDWLNPTQDMLYDRGMMGDGVIDIAGLRHLVESQGFSGFNEVEIFSKHNWWQRDPDEVMATIIERAKKC